MIASQMIENIPQNAVDAFETMKGKMYEEITENGFKSWIEPLKLIKFENNTMTMFHDYDPNWVHKHYGDMIKKFLNEGSSQEIFIEFTNKEN